MTNDLRNQLQTTLSGTHTLERELGGGGMSKVFVAEELRLKRKVVVKVLSPELAQGISVDRFEREIQTVAALQQANIVPVISAGDTNGLPYYTMPFVEGESLRARLGRGPMAVTEVIGILRDVSKALAYAHARGVVHRDIKPDNVLLSGGTAVVTDFGIAKAISAARTQAGAGATLTQIGTSIGTPAYMAPEQAAGDPGIDHRADIYSLGAMAYELLSGQAVFANRTPQRMLAAHMGEAPKSITEFRGDLPPALADLVMQCLAKEADQRPQQAGDIARVLESITSGSGMQSMPPVLLGGPGMFKKALAIYAGAFVAVAILAKAAIVGIGLPDWVFAGSLIVMALGLPVVLWTGYVQRVARRAMAMTPTYTPGGTPSMVQGTMATMALKAAPKMSWYRTARGGMYAFGVFIVMIGAFMAMRQMGIGPFGSLIATGAFSARDKVVVADFTVSGADSSLGRVVGDAIRAGLGDSRVFTLMSAAEIGAALQRMQRPMSSAVSGETARQIALREGAKAIIEGDVTLVGTSYIVAARLVTPDSGRELASFRGTASGSDAIINVADDISRKLRAKAGESLKRVAATPALAYASTSSLEALRKYSDAVRANDAERDYMKAARLLREAVALDSNFAEGWRKLAVAIRNSGGFAPSVADSAITRALALSGRMTERERDAVIAYYYQFSPGLDRRKALDAYERMLARGDSLVALNNGASLYRGMRQFTKAETLFKAAIRIQPSNQSAYNNLILVYADQGKSGERDSVLAVVRERFGASGALGESFINAMAADGRFEDMARALDSARKAGDRRDPGLPFRRSAGFAGGEGRLRDAFDFESRARALDSTAGRPQPAVVLASGRLFRKLSHDLPFEAELKVFDAEVAKYNIESLPANDRPYSALVGAYAAAGRVDRARELLAQYDALLARDSTLRRTSRQDREYAEAMVRRAEKKWNEAAALMRKADMADDGANGPCEACLHRDLADLFTRAGMADSAIAAYEAYRKTGVGSRPRQGPDNFISRPLSLALAKAYDAKGDAANAARLYADVVERWKNADPELQPRVAEAKARLAKLGVVEPVKR